MSLCIPEWIFGEEEFCDICYFHWEPHLTMQMIEENKGILGFSFLSKEGESLLYSAVPENVKHTFFDRYHSSVNILVSKLHIDSYIRSLINVVVPSGEISKEKFLVMNDEFFFEILNYDLTNVVSIQEHLISLIFFDSWEPVVHTKFVYYPLGGTKDE